ncbi:hypothetical protein [Parerythrobacter aestuarii]|uniref:hypothetical protein n=1 Tax=Parerythrobacter aestuarii TaxID=3020909 RepID=UPI0024DECE07|nr:hypothetical protein [Parerythrobacter aestuarii]
MAEQLTDNELARSKADGKSALVVVGMFALLVIAGPLLFFGLLAAGQAGYLDFFAANIWAIALVVVAIPLCIWLPILWVGGRLDRKYLEREASERALAKDSERG